MVGIIVMADQGSKGAGPETALFACKAYSCRLTLAVCARRQVARGPRHAQIIFPMCGGGTCAQGKENLVQLRAGGYEPPAYSGLREDYGQQVAAKRRKGRGPF
jgi:hypothetical protein